MALMSTCLGRLGSRYSIIFDPIRQEVQYGGLGLLCQQTGQITVGIDTEKGFKSLPLHKKAKGFFNVDQWQTMTSVNFEGNCPDTGLRLTASFVAPFWPQDEQTSLVPAYIVKLRVEPVSHIRWNHTKKGVKRSGKVRFTLDLPGVETKTSKGKAALKYDVTVGEEIKTGEGGQELVFGRGGRSVKTDGTSHDLIVPLEGDWKVTKGVLEVPFDCSDGEVHEFSLALVGYVGDALFERFSQAMPLKYTTLWNNADDVAKFVEKNHKDLVARAETFDTLFEGSALPVAGQDLLATSFQSYLMCSLWTVGEKPREWFSVWEGSCWYNSTVDVTFQESMFYFTLWPQLLEMLFEEWSHHVDDKERDAARRNVISDDERFGVGEDEFNFPGAVMEHDMGAGWTANGQSYHHAMPVEENSNFLIMLYAHGKWWGKESLYKKYKNASAQLVEYLLWADSTGNGFPDRGTANTIDDATPAVQYGRDNVYLGIKRLAAIHSAMRMFEYTGDKDLAERCRKEVNKSVKTLNKGWLGDHWGVCLDKSAEGLIDCWTREPLPYDELPGWDAYSLYTTNGLVPLLMIDDLPEGISAEKLRQDVVNATRESMTRYGCGHSSMDTENMWVSMNMWRDVAAGYLGENMLDNSTRYWNQQLFANTLGSEKANCFTETSLTNNLVWYPRNAAAFGMVLAATRLVMDGTRKQASISPILPGVWPLLPLANWNSATVPLAAVDITEARMKTTLTDKPAKGFKLTVKKE
ncbi:MAG: glutaminase domain-containing protein [Phycisphaerae bacterium]